MKSIFYLTIIIIYLIIVIINQLQIDNYELNSTHSLNKITFRLKTINGLNLTYVDNNLYLTNNFGYIFIGILHNPFMYRLKNPINNFNFVLNYDIYETAKSNIILESDTQYNLNSTTIPNLFNQTNKNIYLDPINKIILSNDNSGNIVYLSTNIIENPVNWNYNINDATKFEIIYL